MKKSLFTTIIILSFLGISQNYCISKQAVIKKNYIEKTINNSKGKEKWAKLSTYLIKKKYFLIPPNLSCSFKKNGEIVYARGKALKLKGKWRVNSKKQEIIIRDDLNAKRNIFKSFKIIYYAKDDGAKTEIVFYKRKVFIEPEGMEKLSSQDYFLLVVED